MLLTFARLNRGMTRVLTGDALVNEDARLQERAAQFTNRIDASLRQLRGAITTGTLAPSCDPSVLARSADKRHTGKMVALYAERVANRSDAKRRTAAQDAAGLSTPVLRLAQTRQPGSRRTRTECHFMSVASRISSRPTSDSPMPAITLIASAACMRAADDTHKRCENAHGGAVDVLDVVCLREQAVVVGGRRITCVENTDLAVEANRRTRHQRLAVVHTGTVDRVARCKIVGAIDHQIHMADFGHERLGVEPRRACLDLNVGIQCPQSLATGLCLEFADAVAGVQNLALQVAQFDAVMVGEDNLTNPGRSKVHRDWRSQTARADDEHSGSQQFFLTFDPQVIEQDMTGVPK